MFFILGLVMICIAGDRLVDAAVAIANKLINSVCISPITIKSKFPS